MCRKTGSRATSLFTRSNANDLSPNAYNGTVNGASLTSDRFNMQNSAYSFNGTTNYISTAYSGILGANPRAVAFWMKTQSTIAMPAVVWGGDLQGERFDCGFNYVNSGTTIDGANCAITYSTIANISDNAWHHYVFQFSNPTLDQVKIFQDGILLTQTANTFNPTNPINTANDYNVNFGGLITPPNYFFNGQLDDIGIWSRTLTNCEIQQLYKSVLNVINIACSATAICTGQSATLTTSGATNYSWNNSSSSSVIVVTPQTNTTYTVTGTTSNGCVSSSNIAINVASCTGIINLQPGNTQLEIFPNPTTGPISLQGCAAGSCVKIYNVLGKLIYETIVEKENTEVDFLEQPKGIYFVKVSFRDNSIVKKVIKENYYFFFLSLFAGKT